ncbi:MAG: M1 family metallopeptidase [Planctomycetaceae bacterium]
MSRFQDFRGPILFGVLAFLGLAVESHTLSADPLFRSAADRPVDITHIRLDLDVSLKEEKIAGTATIDFQPNLNVNSVTLDAVGHEVSKIELVRSPSEKTAHLQFQNTGKKLIVRFGKTLPRGQKSQLQIHYRVRSPKSGLHFFRPTKLEPKTPWMVWSQGEPRANRYWFPCFDHPNERQSTELIVRVNREFSVLSNGKLIERKEIENGKRVQFHWKQTKPHVSYLVTLVAGKFAILKENWRGRPITYYVHPDREQDARRTFGRTLEMLDFFSKRFGIEYPWEKYAQVVVEQFTSGGMENTSATTLYQGVMHDKRALLDSSPDRLIAHELGHQWWGDLVTCRDWAHLWLNEGFATYCEVLWYEHKLGRDERDYLLYQKSRSARSGTALQRPIVDRKYSEPRTMFDVRAYPKGGWVLHMLRSRLGDELFFRGLNRYGVVFSYRTAETSDFRKVFERAFGVSLERFFHDWTQRKGHPRVTVESTYQPADQLMRVVIRQTQKEEPFRFPLKIELTKAGDHSNSVTMTPQIDQKEHTFLIPVKNRPEAVRVDPDFTLLAEIHETKARDWWKNQLLHAPTIAERIRAVEHFGKRGRQADRELLITALKTDPFYGVRIEAANALARRPHSSVRDALLAGVKQPHPKVRRVCISGLARYRGDQKLLDQLTKRQKQGDPSYYVEAALIETISTVQKQPDLALLKRALKMPSHRDVIRQAALKGLGKSAAPEAVALLEEWVTRGHSRSSRLTAMSVLANSLKTHQFPDQIRQRAVARLAEQLSDYGPRVRRAAMAALAKIPHLAQSYKTKIEEMAVQDADGRVRAAAVSILKQFEKSAAASKVSSDEVKKLRAELKVLRERNQKLQERLKQLEKKAATSKE